jgi:hypothetical protein
MTGAQDRGEDSRARASPALASFISLKGVVGVAVLDIRGNLVESYGNVSQTLGSEEARRQFVGIFDQAPEPCRTRIVLGTRSFRVHRCDLNTLYASADVGVGLTPLGLIVAAAHFGTVVVCHDRPRHLGVVAAPVHACMCELRA